MAMEYREYPPCERLRPYVRCYWTLRGAALDAPVPQRVFPDGCMEMIFHLGDPFSRVLDNGRAERQQRTLLAGQIWSPLTLQAVGQVDVVAVRFRPNGAWPFLRFPLHEIGGRIEALEHVWGVRARRWRDALGEAADRVAVLERLLLTCRVEQGAEFPALSERQRRRRYLERVGVAPKLLERIQRFQRALSSTGQMPLARVAVECGYADQSHLVRDFRQFAGMPPSKWLKSSEDVRFFQDALTAEALD